MYFHQLLTICKGIRSNWYDICWYSDPLELDTRTEWIPSYITQQGRKFDIHQLGVVKEVSYSLELFSEHYLCRLLIRVNYLNRLLIYACWFISVMGAATIPTPMGKNSRTTRRRRHPTTRTTTTNNATNSDSHSTYCQAGTSTDGGGGGWWWWSSRRILTRTWSSRISIRKDCRTT